MNIIMDGIEAPDGRKMERIAPDNPLWAEVDTWSRRAALAMVALVFSFACNVILIGVLARALCR